MAAQATSRTVEQNAHTLPIHIMDSTYVPDELLLSHGAHWHDELQLTYLLEGEGYVHAPNAHLVIEPGCGALTLPRVVHRAFCARGSTWSSITFPAGVLEHPAAASASPQEQTQELEIIGTRAILFDGSEKWHELALSSIKRIHYLLVESEPNAAMRYEAIAHLQLIWALCRENLEHQPVTGVKLAEERITSMVTLIEEHYADNLSLKDIAQAANVSESECLRCFRNALGITPYAYLTQVRIDSAARLLAKDNRPIIDIAYACGFSGPSHFSKVFRKFTGVSPRSYRKQFHDNARDTSDK